MHRLQRVTDLLESYQRLVDAFQQRLVTLETHTTDYVNSLIPEVGGAIIELRGVVADQYQLIERLEPIVLAKNYDRFSALEQVLRQALYPLDKQNSSEFESANELMPIHWIAQAEKLIAYNTCSTGTDHVDKQALADRGIELLCITKDIDLLNSFTATAELAFSLLLACMRNFRAANRAAPAPNDKHPGRAMP